MARAQRVGPFQGRYHPAYRLTFWNGGDPRNKVHGVDLRSVVAIQTSKSLEDVSGTFTITLKDARARHLIQEMDVVRIELRGHDGQGLASVFKGVVDTTRRGGSADTYASREDTVIEGRCMAKYLQITSLFLPVWDPQSLLPTALIFGLGDATKKAGGNSPYDIFQYLVKRFTFGQRNFAGVSGVPNSRFWLDPKSRFSKVDFQVPFIQFDEDTVADALKAMEILGYTETWVDELGRVVYRHPQWDAPARYVIPTGSLKDWDLHRTDIGVATYIEVIPAGDPGIDSATAQALRAGRAPVPSSYLSGLPDPSAFSADKDFIIDTDSKGRVTAKGKKNFWYRRQRRLGLRPQQITQPLLFTQEQAQAEAEGLLQFYGRMVKGGQIVTPGYPSARLGTTARLVGPLDGGKIDTGYYVEGVQHEYVEGETYTTTWQLSHGRDPWDPKWGRITIPKFDPAQLSAEGGVLDPGGGISDSTGVKGKVKIAPGANRAGVGLASILLDFLALVSGVYGHELVVTTGTDHNRLTVNGNVSDHWDGHAADLGMVANGGTDDGPVGDHIAAAAMVVCGLSKHEALSKAHAGGLYNLQWNGHRVQVIWKTNEGGNHHDHDHIGVR